LVKTFASRDVTVTSWNVLWQDIIRCRPSLLIATLLRQ